jgi:uncharacterized heparinase superfamily protein
MHAPNSGYERLEAGRVVVVADVGPPPPLPYSINAGAGCLSFEMSSGPQRIVINCGQPASGPELRRVARSTAAHSTATVADTSSCRFLQGGGWWGERRAAEWLAKRIGTIVLRGPRAVKAERTASGEAQVLAARHDGYAGPFGIVHERRWTLSPDGALAGEDAFVRTGKASHRPHEAAIRFHLHPTIEVRGSGEGRFHLSTPAGEAWHFLAEGAEAAIEESVYFAGLTGARRTDQIVLYLTIQEDARVRWRFTRSEPA